MGIRKLDEKMRQGEKVIVRKEQPDELLDIKSVNTSHAANNDEEEHADGSLIFKFLMIRTAPY